MTFHLPASYYEPPDDHECDDGPDCECAEKAEQDYQAQLDDAADAERKERR